MRGSKTITLCVPTSAATHCIGRVLVGALPQIGNSSA
ncbi:Uncharacterised protein [Vibrio cholerae]|nr:Uncharacterised protein [Vibrio cholerae]